MREIVVPHISANEDSVVVAEICKEENQYCKKGELIAILESTKTSCELEAEEDGYVLFVVSKDESVRMGQVIAYLSERGFDRQFIEQKKKERLEEQRDSLLNITAKAQVLINRHGLNALDIKTSGLIKTSDVESFLKRSQPEAVSKDVPLNYAELEKVFKLNHSGSVTTDEVERLKKVFLFIRDTYDRKWNRRIPILDILFDRWSNGEKNNFGPNSNISHLSFILGSIKGGDNIFIGPFTYIDGTGGLEIGDNCSIATGVQIYSHDTIARALSGRKAERTVAATKIGKNCFFGPHAVITKGVTIGDHCFVGANSVVVADILPNTMVMGVPARKVGNIVIAEDGNVSFVSSKS